MSLVLLPLSLGDHLDLNESEVPHRRCGLSKVGGR
jgi:hypothetical protein